MTYVPHFLLSFGGSLAAGVEEWSNNIRMIGPAGGTFGAITNAQGALDDVAADVRAHVANISAGYGGSTFLEWVKFNEIDENGRYKSTSEAWTKEWSGTERVAGGAGNPGNIAPQMACAVTFETTLARGKASKGRCYIPQPGLSISSTTGLYSASLQPVADAWALFIRNLRNWPGMDWPNSPVPGVVSNVGVPGPAAEIVRVSVDSRPDVQRRRAKSLVGVRSTSAV